MPSDATLLRNSCPRRLLCGKRHKGPVFFGSRRSGLVRRGGVLVDPSFDDVDLVRMQRGAFVGRRHSVVVGRGDPRQQFALIRPPGDDGCAGDHQSSGFESQVRFLFQCPVTGVTFFTKDRFHLRQVVHVRRIGRGRQTIGRQNDQAGSQGEDADEGGGGRAHEDASVGGGAV